MIIKSTELLKNIKVLKPLTYNKIQKTSYIDNLPKTINDVIDNKQYTFNKKQIETFHQMVLTCIKNDGIGLSANQVGINKKFFIMFENEHNPKESYKVYIHPSFKPTQDAEIKLNQEGCLSVPNKSILVPRYTKIVASWIEINNKNEIEWKEEIIEGMKSICMQHETSHLAQRTILDDSKLIDKPFTPV